MGEPCTASGTGAAGASVEIAVAVAVAARDVGTGLFKHVSHPLEEAACVTFVVGVVVVRFGLAGRPPPLPGRHEIHWCLAFCLIDERVLFCDRRAALRLVVMNWRLGFWVAAGYRLAFVCSSASNG